MPLKKGSIVKISARVKHWHDASENNRFTHIAMEDWSKGQPAQSMRSSGLWTKVQFLRYARKNHPPGCGSIPFRPSDAFEDHPVDAQTDHSRYGNMSAIFKTCGACHSSAFVPINACTSCIHGLK